MTMRHVSLSACHVSLSACHVSLSACTGEKVPRRGALGVTGCRVPCAQGRVTCGAGARVMASVRLGVVRACLGDVDNVGDAAFDELDVLVVAVLAIHQPSLWSAHGQRTVSARSAHGLSAKPEPAAAVVQNADATDAHMPAESPPPPRAVVAASASLRARSRGAALA